MLRGGLTKPLPHGIIKKKREVKNMYEYYIESIYTGERRTVHGYNVKDAFRRAKLASIEWGVVYVEYVD
jgi:hypothetical protein